MHKYIIRRILMLIPVLIGISLCIFLIMHILPGNAADLMLGVETTPEAKKTLEQQFGLNLPLYKQYLNWISGVVVGNFGYSFRTGRAILPEIISRFGVTFELTLLSAVISWIIAIPLGIVSALKRNTFVDFIVRVISLLGVSVPGFAFATILILVLSVCFSYYTPVGYVSFFVDPLKNLQMLIIPAIILGTSLAGSTMRMTRSSILEVLRQDFIRTIKAKGAPKKVVIYKHALRNSLIPIITIIGMQIGILLGGTVIIEQIFSLPGLGQMTLTAIYQRDLPTVQGCILFIASVFVIVNLIVDLLYKVVDPRISYK